MHDELEGKAVIKARIQEAAQYVSLSLLRLSPQCGFPSSEEGKLTNEAKQQAKLRLVVEIAQRSEARARLGCKLHCLALSRPARWRRLRSLAG